MTQTRGSDGAWTEAAAGDLSGRVAVVTGGNTGLGLQTARVLAGHGATVVLACRDESRGAAAAQQLSAGLPAGRVQTVPLDLASLDSVRAAAGQITSRFPRLDLLINNAGVMATPYGLTADGAELQFGVNHLGHFALTGLVLPALLQAGPARVVTISSGLHRYGRIRFADLDFSRGYRKWAAYSQSKLANLLFSYELGRRLAAASAPVLSVAAHPGVASTELTRHLPSLAAPFTSGRLGLLTSWWTQDAAAGALPAVRAATDPAAASGDYFGPAGLLELTGPPVLVRSSARSHDAGTAHRLWTESEKLTGVRYAI